MVVVAKSKDTEEEMVATMAVVMVMHTRLTAAAGVKVVEAVKVEVMGAARVAGYKWVVTAAEVAEVEIMKARMTALLEVVSMAEVRILAADMNFSHQFEGSTLNKREGGQLRREVIVGGLRKAFDAR